MELIKKTINNGYIITYKIINGIAFHEETDSKVCEILLRYLHNRDVRLKLDYGDTITGKSWGESHDITGYIGNSIGKIKIPLLLNNSKSISGGSILDHCIIKIEYANKKHGIRPLYELGK